MSVCDEQVVDAIGIENATGKVVLTVSDHLEWNDDHLAVLETKLNSYIAFIEGGELTMVYPDAIDREPVIDVVCKFEPSLKAEEFFTKVREVLENVGVEFRYRVLTV